VRLNPGDSCHELGAGAAGITAYLDAVREHHYLGTNLGIRERLEGVYELFCRSRGIADRAYTGLSCQQTFEGTR
jgi:hypothetical protein